MLFTFTYSGKVRGQGRPRFAYGHAYESNTDKRYKLDIRQQYQTRHGPHFGAQPLGVTIDVMRALPKSMPKFVANQDDLGKPDVDNVAKAVLDALKGVAFDDDTQIVSLTVRKFPRVRMDSDRMRITIATVADDLLYPYEFADERGNNEAL